MTFEVFVGGEWGLIEEARNMNVVDTTSVRRKGKIYLRLLIYMCHELALRTWYVNASLYQYVHTNNLQLTPPWEGTRLDCTRSF